MSESHYLGDFTALLKNRFDQKMYVDTRDQSVVPHLLCDGSWEYWITNVFCNFAKGAVVLDIGANAGWYSCMASLCGAKKVYAFEPNARLANLLTRTSAVNGFNWVVWNTALSDETRTGALHFNWEMQGGATLEESDTENKQSVACMRLDDIEVPAGFKDSDFLLKIDVEGHEPRVILGAQKLIESKNCFLLVEHHSDPNGEHRNVEMWDFMKSAGYLVSHIPNGVSAPQQIEYSAIPSVPETDMLFFQRIAR